MGLWSDPRSSLDGEPVGEPVGEPGADIFAKMITLRYRVLAREISLNLYCQKIAYTKEICIGQRIPKKLKGYNALFLIVVFQARFYNKADLLMKSWL